MSDLLPFLIVGVASGSLFGLAGLGLVLTFKTTGVFNFAHGGVAAISAYFFYDLHYDVGLPWPIALVICVGGFGALAGVLLERMARSLDSARMVLSIVATVGLLLLTQGFLTVRYGPSTLEFPAFLPQRSIGLAGVAVTYEQIIVALVGLGAAVSLLVFFRRTRLGMAMRAVVDDPSLLSLAAIPPARVRTAAWAIGCSFASLSGVLLAPSLGRDPQRLTLLVVQAFGAAAVGRFSSLPATYVGGLVIGVTASLSTDFVSDKPYLIGLPSSIPFLVLFAALLLTPAKKLAVRAPRVMLRTVRTPVAWSRQRRATSLGAVAVVALVLPQLVDSKLPVYISAAVLLPMFLSLSLLVWTSGQLSLCHAAFVALGATTFSHLTSAGLPWLVALVGAGLLVVPLGAAVAIPAIRLSGIYLALATFGFGILMQRMVYSTGFMFGGTGFRGAPRPELGFLDGNEDRWYFLIVVAVTMACVALVAGVQRSRLGRILRALGDSPAALTSLGADANVARLLVFCIAGFLAGISGAMSIAATSQVSVDTFGLYQSLLWLTVLGICSSNLLASPALAAALLAVVPSYLPSSLLEYQPLFFGAAAVLTAVAVDRSYRLGRRGLGRGGRSPAAQRYVPRPMPSRRLEVPA